MSEKNPVPMRKILDTAVYSEVLKNLAPQGIARNLVWDWIQSLKGDPIVAEHPIQFDDVYVVWFCKTLQNWKCLLSTPIPDGRYYEVTYNGDKKQVYLDTYKKTHNHAIQL